MATLTLTQAVDVSTKGKKSFGMNPHHLNYWNAYRFLNIMKHSGEWSDYSVVDAQGYPAQPGTFTAAIHSGTNDDHGGTYTVTWEGSGTLTVAGSPATVHGRVSAPAWNPTARNAIRFTLDGGNGANCLISITNGARDFVRNIEIVNDAYAAEYAAGELLIPGIRTLYQGYETLRSLWWCNEPGGNHHDWHTALPVDGYTYKTILGGGPKKVGVPYSVFIDICNQLQADPWICVPSEADDYYITQLATLVRDQLDPSLLAKFEYTNEAWNGGFAAYPCRWGAWKDGWRAGASETYLDWVTDFSGWTAVGCTIGDDGVTITEDTSTGEHYIETTIAYGDSFGRTLLLLLDAATAAGCRLSMNDGTTTLEAIFDLATDTVSSSSGAPGYDPAQIHDMGSYKALWTNGAQASGPGRTIRIQFTDAAFATSYTGTSNTLTLKRAQVCSQTSGVHTSWYAKRAAQMRDIVETVFNATGRPFRTILAWQASAGLNGAHAVVNAVDWSYNDGAGLDLNPRAYQSGGEIHDTLSLATYFGNYNITGPGGVFSRTNCTELWAAYDGAGGEGNPAAMTALIIDNDGIGNLSGYLADQAIRLQSFISQYASVARANGMGLAAYEGGNHSLFGFADTDLHAETGYLRPGIFDVAKAALYGDDAAILWEQVLDHWKAEGGQTWCQLTDIMNSSSAPTGGFFGLRNYPGEVNAVATAVEAWSLANPRWWVR